jgi:threonine dehydrogenase-like Zn-dependent dehydrogenase
MPCSGDGWIGSGELGEDSPTIPPAARKNVFGRRSHAGGCNCRREPQSDHYGERAASWRLASRKEGEILKAIAIVPGTAGSHLVERPEPSITRPDEVKVRVIRVGICGTDRKEVSGDRAEAQDGQKDLVIGHEMFGQVLSAGSSVTRVKLGDYEVFTVRRGCGECSCCLMNRADMCQTGKYRERGIHALDGYQTEYVVDQEQYIVLVPAELEPVGVLLEPLSVVEKAIDEALRVQTVRCPDAATIPDWFHGRHCLIAGLGPVGLLAAMVLRLRGGEVYGLDVVDSNTSRPKWLDGIGGRYIDGREVPADQVEKKIGGMDFILDASGIAQLEFNLLDALAQNGMYVITGIPAGDRPLQIPGTELIRQLVLDNQVMLGSVNAARGHFQMGVDDMAQAHLRWGTQIAGLITNRYAPDQFAGVMDQHPSDGIKEVIEWA